MLINKSTLENFTKGQTLTQKISYTTEGSYNKTFGKKKDGNYTTMENELGFLPSDITIKVDGLKVYISNRPFIEVLRSIRAKEIDLESLDEQFMLDDAQMQLAVKEAKELVKEANEKIASKKRRNPIHALSGVLSQYADEERFYLNYYPIYKNEAKYTTYIKGVEATQEQLDAIAKYKKPKRESESSTIKEFNFKRDMKYRNVKLESLIQ